MKDHNEGDKSAIAGLGVVPELFPGPQLVLVMVLSQLADAIARSDSSWAWPQEPANG
jgi:hypothetical protein